MECINYRQGYKYQLTSPYTCQTGFTLAQPVESSLGYIKLTTAGQLIIKKGYAWDGPSGPTIDTKNFMRGSVVHDALYQLMREKLLPSKYKKPADELLHRMCITDGMWRIRACWVFEGLQIGGGEAIKPANRKPILIAP